MNEIQRMMQSLAQRFIEIFDLGLKQPLKPIKVEIDPFVAPLYAGRIPIRGEGIDGWLILETDQKFLHETHPERRYGADLEGNDYLDWVTEIVNRTLAGTKPAILDMGWALRLEQPQALQGQLDQETPSPLEASQMLESMGFYAKLRIKFSKLEVPARMVG